MLLSFVYFYFMLHEHFSRKNNLINKTLEIIHTKNKVGELYEKSFVYHFFYICFIFK